MSFNHILHYYKMISYNLLLIIMMNISIMGMIHAQDKQRIAILTLLNQAKLKGEEVDYLTNVVRQSFASKMGRGYLVMTQENILTLLPENKKIEDCLDECEVDVGRNLGASLIVTGSILIFNKNYRLNIKVHETKEGALLASEIAKGNNLDEVEISIISSVDILINTLKTLAQNDQKNLAEQEIQKAKLLEAELKKREEAQQAEEKANVERLAKEAKEKAAKEKAAKEKAAKEAKEAKEEKAKAEKQANEERIKQQELEIQSIKKVKNLERLEIENVKGFGINTGFGTSTSYSGMGFQLGMSYIGEFVNSRLLLSYGGLQSKATSALPGASFQIYFGGPSTHVFGLGFNYLSYEVDKPSLPYQISIKSFDLIYKIDFGDFNGFELQLGLSLESRNAIALKDEQKISDLSGISPMFLLGLNYIFEVTK